VATSAFSATLLADTALAASNERIVFTASSGNDTIINFGASTGTELGTREVFTATFGGSTTAGNVGFDGVTYVTPGTTTTGVVHAADFATAYNLAAGTNYTAAVVGGTADVIFTAKNVGFLTDATFAATVLSVTVSVTAQGAAPVIDADVLDFSALGGSSAAGFNNALSAAGLASVFVVGTASKSIIIDDLVKPTAPAVAVAGSNNTTADLVANLFADSGTAAAKTFVYVAVDAATNIGSVYSVSDAVGGTAGATTTATGSNVAATLVGTIELDTSWSSLTAANFS
jgi:hypothetical protein